MPDPPPADRHVVARAAARRDPPPRAPPGAADGCVALRPAGGGRRAAGRWVPARRALRARGRAREREDGGRPLAARRARPGGPLRLGGRAGRALPARRRGARGGPRAAAASSARRPAAAGAGGGTGGDAASALGALGGRGAARRPARSPPSSSTSPVRSGSFRGADAAARRLQAAAEKGGAVGLWLAAPGGGAAGPGRGAAGAVGASGGRDRGARGRLGGDRERARGEGRPCGVTLRRRASLALHLPDLPLQRLRRARERRTTASRPWRSGGGAGGVLRRGGARGGRPQRARRPRRRSPRAGGSRRCRAIAAADRAALRALAEVLLALAPAVEVAPPDVLLARRQRRAPARAPPARRSPRAVGRRGAPRGAGALAAAAEMGYARVRGRRDGARAGAGAWRRATAARGGDGPAAWSGPRDGTARALARAAARRRSGCRRPSRRGSRRSGSRTRARWRGCRRGRSPTGSAPEGVAAARLARGEDDSPLVPYVPATLPEEALELEAPAECAEPLLFALKRLADRVAARLAGRGLGASRLEARPEARSAWRGAARSSRWRSRPPSAARWLVPAKEHLFALRLPGRGHRRSGSSRSRWRSSPSSSSRSAIGRRRSPRSRGCSRGSRCGSGTAALFAAEPVERYRPEGAYRAGAVPACGRRGRRGPGRCVAGAGRAARRRAARPASAARPGSLLARRSWSWRRGRAVGSPRCAWAGATGRCSHSRGRSGCAGEWWAGAFDRDYYRVRLDGLGDCWVYRDGADGRLYLHGFFD